jgi:copper transport protein
VNALLQALSRSIVLVWLLLAMSGAAYGHAVVVATVPADGALVETGPDQVVVRFNEPITPVSAQVLNATGDVISPADPASVQGDELRIALPSQLAQGTYIASYRVISSDSHPVGGSIVFSVGRVSERVTAPIRAADDRGWMAAMVVVRAVLFAGVLGGAGGVLFLLLVRPADLAYRATARTAAGLAGAGALAAFIAIPIQGGLLLGGPVSSLANAATWRIGLTSGFGTTAIVAFAGLACVTVGLWLDRQAILRPLVYVGAAVALTSFALSGHIVTAGPRWITVPVLLTHTTAVAFWIGSLLPLHQAIARSDAKAAPVVQRFSRTAVIAVSALVVAGLIIAVLQVQSFGGLASTAYGLILLAKLALVTGLLGLAVLNKLRLTPRLARGDQGAGTALRRTIAAEAVLVFGILMATAALGTTPPPRVLAGAAEGHRGHIMSSHRPAARGLSVTIIAAGGSAEILLNSDRGGINSAQLWLFSSAGTRLQAQEVTFIAANPGAGVEPIRRAADVVEPGHWHVDNLLLVPSGKWVIRVDVLVSDFEKATLETVITLH